MDIFRLIKLLKFPIRDRFLNTIDNPVGVIHQTDVIGGKEFVYYRIYSDGNYLLPLPEHQFSNIMTISIQMYGTCTIDATDFLGTELRIYGNPHTYIKLPRCDLHRLVLSLVAIIAPFPNASPSRTQKLVTIKTSYGGLADYIKYDTLYQLDHDHIFKITWMTQIERITSKPFFDRTCKLNSNGDHYLTNMIGGSVRIQVASQKAVVLYLNDYIDILWISSVTPANSTIYITSQSGTTPRVGTIITYISTTVDPTIPVNYLYDYSPSHTKIKYRYIHRDVMIPYEIANRSDMWNRENAYSWLDEI